MRVISSFEEVNTYINQERGLNQDFLTNFFLEQRKVEIWIFHKILWKIKTDDAAIFLKKDNDFTSLMYCATKSDEFFAALALLLHAEVYVAIQIIDARTDKSRNERRLWSSLLITCILSRPYLYIAA